jgi:hypothetical protein
LESLPKYKTSAEAKFLQKITDSRLRYKNFDMFNLNHIFGLPSDINNSMIEEIKLIKSQLPD